MFNTAPAQNAAHRADLVWIKVGHSEYMRADGVVIRKNQRIASFWEVFLPNGDKAASPNMFASDGFLSALPAAGYSLTDAKWIATKITSDSPAYVPLDRR